ncbi:unnamed protein product [Ranitomeya imitator]|uniref:Uncharacterized protein n=1 Tax=Ranitomeya imitator TaxID=111125 RepID=A0ABN9KY46_9NEOB|nr:unnamed protein product [Ranitomeya imitator]
MKVKKEKREEEEETEVAADAPEVPERTYEEQLENLNPIAQPLAGRKLTKRLYKCIKKGESTKHRNIRRGVKEVQKFLNKGEKGIVVLAGDTLPIEVYCHVPVMCEERSIPYAYVPSKSVRLRILGLGLHILGLAEEINGPRNFRVAQAYSLLCSNSSGSETESCSASEADSDSDDDSATIGLGDPVEEESVVTAEASEAGPRACGTVGKNRVGFPSQLVSRPLERGASFSLASDQLLAVKWKDRKDVYMLSTLHADTTVTVRERGATRDKEKPVCVTDYNKHMGGVDLSDQFLQPYLVKRKTRAWYKKVAIYLIQTATYNSFVLYEKSQGPLTFLHFQEKVVESLIVESMAPGEAFDSEDSRRLSERHFPHPVPVTPTQSAHSQCGKLKARDMTRHRNALGAAAGSKRPTCVILIKFNDDYEDAFNDCLEEVQALPLPL